MAHDAANGLESGRDRFKLVEFTVVLVDDTTNPSLLSSEYLSHVGISEEDWVVRSTFSIPVFSEVVFEHGLSLRFEPNRVIVEQRADPLNVAQIQSPKVTKQYLHSLPYNKCSAVGLNAKGYRAWDRGAPQLVSDALHQRGQWMSYQDTMPEIEMKATYRLPSRVVSLEIIGGNSERSNDAEPTGLWFNSNFHHDISADNGENRIRSVDAIIDSWQTELDEFTALTNIFNP